MTDIPHLTWPPRMAPDGTLAAVEQDTVEDVRQCVHVLLRTPLGVRPLAPFSGVPDPTFSGGVIADELAARLGSDDNEPRAQITVTAGQLGATGGQSVRVRVDLADEPLDETA